VQVELQIIVLVIIELGLEETLPLDLLQHTAVAVVAVMALVDI
jgi:hypothetical protein